MINEMVKRSLTNSGKSKTWLAQQLGNMAWSTLNDKLKNNTFTAEELINLSVILDDFDVQEIIEKRKLERSGKNKAYYVTVEGPEAYKAVAHLTGSYEETSDELMQLRCDCIPSLNLIIKEEDNKKYGYIEKLKSLPFNFKYTIEEKIEDDTKL